MAAGEGIAAICGIVLKVARTARAVAEASIASTACLRTAGSSDLLRTSRMYGGMRQCRLDRCMRMVSLSSDGIGGSRRVGFKANLALVKGPEFDEALFFRAISASGLRALLIGRRALIALGIPVMTSDYDFWIHIDDIEGFNAEALPFALIPDRTPLEARRSGRYRLQNDELVDVLVARSVPGPDGPLVFDGVWSRRNTLGGENQGSSICVPGLDDLIASKRIGSRPKDAEDVRLLQHLRKQREAL